MGCPPDPIEVSMFKSRDRIAELTDQYNELTAFCKKALEEISQISKGLPEVEQKKCQDFISSFPTDAFETRDFDRSIISYDENDPYRDANDISSKEYYAATEVKRLENSYCEILHYLNYQIEYPSEIEEKKIKATQVEFQQAYRKHRLEDVQTWLAWLADRQRLYQYQIEKQEDKKVNAQLALKKVEKEIARVNALAEETILKDRSSFGRNREEFDIV